MYVKLFASLYQGTLRGNSHGILVFTNLLAHADKEGCVDVHPRAIAEEVGLPIEAVRETLLMLESPDDESRSPAEQGRRIVRMDEHRAWGWRIVNYAKYRAIRNEEDRREQNRLAQEKWRAKSKPPSAEPKQDKPRKPPSAYTEAEAEEDISSPTVKRYARKRAESVEVSSLVAAGFSEQSAADFIAHKSAKKAPLTARAWEDHKREAAKAGWTPMAAAEKVMARNWAGFEAKYVADDPKPGVSHQSFRERDAELASARVAEMTGGIGAARTKRNGVIDGCITEVGGEAVFPAGRALRVKVDEPLERP